MKVWWAVEAKWSDNPKSRTLLHFMEKNKLSKGIHTGKTIF